jgi:P4 family phage/plasmid primase-like protien
MKKSYAPTPVEQRQPTKTDWRAKDREIISALGQDGILSAYQSLGTRFEGQPRPNGKAECYGSFRSPDNPDQSPSAYVDTKTGRFKDSGAGDTREMTLWDFAARIDPARFPTWQDARRHFAEVAGVELPTGKRKRKSKSKTNGSTPAPRKPAATSGANGGAPEPREDWRTALNFTDGLPNDAGEPQWSPAGLRHLQHWCRKKPGISPIAVIKNGGRLAEYKCDRPNPDSPGSYFPPLHRVVALPIFGDQLLNADPLSYVIWNLHGHPFPRKSGKPVKMLTVGSGSGVIGLAGLQTIKASAAAGKPVTNLWKVEGPSDLLSLYSALPPDRQSMEPIVSFAGGSTSVPPAGSPQLALFTGVETTVVGDADVAGEAGVRKSCRAFASLGGKVFRTRPLYEIQPKHGADLRDWLTGRGPGDTAPHSVDELDSLREEWVDDGAAIVEAIEDVSPSEDRPTVDSIDPDQLAELDPYGMREERNRTENALANIFITELANLIRYVGPWGKWLVWDGRRFRLDDEHRVESLARKFALDLWRRIAVIPSDESEAAALQRMANRSNSASGIRNLLLLARSGDGVAVLPEQLDVDPMLFNVGNGTLDLRTGKLLGHDPARLITKLAPVEFDPGAVCPTWESTLEQVFRGDVDLVSYIRRAYGYSITGLTSESKLFLNYGKGSNGKTTVVETVLELVGDYGVAAVPDLLLAKGESHLTEVAQLHGRRFVVVSETEDGRRFDEARVKQFTGGDRIAARRMREDLWVFVPTHKFWISTNHRPHLRGTDYGIQRRFALIPFEVTFTDEQKDTTIPHRLREELPGILNWLIAGCREWQNFGLGSHAKVTAATTGYFEAEDLLGQFLEERCNERDGVTIRAGMLFEAYVAWAESQNERPATMRRFGQAIAERGFEKRKFTDGFHYMRLELIPLPEDEPPKPTDASEAEPDDGNFGDAYESPATVQKSILDG